MPREAGGAFARVPSPTLDEPPWIASSTISSLPRRSSEDAIQQPRRRHGARPVWTTLEDPKAAEFPEQAPKFALGQHRRQRP